ncbi:protein of unknown function [Magnetospirillum sp. XM-1]|uniref:hypothetical protein n=1 Tax=Magnetospirillum sp. XM-1 TaxID=1663591 RepID=UPI00073DDA5A|nr:hypothetical protein [Magnetospirillum sp. XM-1]CUW41281.1 protein of unknown function [Magnetospirillum sp. XM-1]
MSDTFLICQTPKALLKPGLIFAVCASLAWCVVFHPDGSPTEWDGEWLPFLILVIPVLASLWMFVRYARNKPVAELSPRGLRAEALGDALVPWNLVTSVTLTSRTMTVITPGGSPEIEAALEAKTRQKVFEVLLDLKAAKVGVKHSENLLTLGFSLVPYELNRSADAIGQAFLAHLPPERCLGFGP